MVRFPTEAIYFSVLQVVYTGCGSAHRGAFLGFFPGGKQLGRVADHFPPSSVEIKNDWNCACTGRFLSSWIVYAVTETLLQNIDL